MTIYVVTDCAAEENYTPAAFDSYEKAKKYFDDLVADCMISADYVDQSDIESDFAEIVYTDDTYDVISIDEIEVR